MGDCVKVASGEYVPRVVTEHCICTEKQVRLTVLIILSIIGLVVFCLVWYFIGMKQVKSWIAQKQGIKRLVKGASKSLSRAETEAEVNSVLGAVEQSNEIGFMFTIDSADGSIWASGQPGFLEKGRVVTGNDANSPSLLEYISAVSDEGGGYVHARWKDQMYVGYVHPVPYSDLVVGAMVPVPSKQVRWEQMHLHPPPSPTSRASSSPGTALQTKSLER